MTALRDQIAERLCVEDAPCSGCVDVACTVLPVLDAWLADPDASQWIAVRVSQARNYPHGDDLDVWITDNVISALRALAGGKP